MGFDKLETSSVSTTFTVAPSVSSSSSSALSSVANISSAKMDSDLKSPSSMHDSTISRLIDAVSLDNEQDTCGSISALIGQFENTVDQNNFPLSHESTPSRHSNYRSTPSKVEESRSPLKNTTASPFKQLISPQKVAQITKRVNHGVCSPCTMSQTDAPTPTLTSSPETAELEEVYTILDEEVLLPVSVYNLKKQTVHVQADTAENRPSSCFGSSPSKVVQGEGNAHNLGWDNVDRKRNEPKETEETEERVYEEVNDLPLTIPESAQGTSKGYLSSTVNDCYQFPPDSARSVFTEVELNVDEDPLERMLASPTHGSQWEGLTSPTKRHAIYQNHNYTSNYPQQKQPLLYRSLHQEYSSHSPHVAFSDLHSPVNQHSNHHQNQTPLHHRRINSKPSNHSPLRQNSYPIPQCDSEALSNSRDFSSSYKQQRSFSGSQIFKKSLQEKMECKQKEKDQVRYFHNGFSSSESLPGQSAVSKKTSRDRNLYSPSSDSDAAYSQPNHDCIRSSPASPVSQSSQSQSQTQSYALKHTGHQKVSHNNARHHAQVESKASAQSNLGPLSQHPQSPTVDSTNPSPCKSKSLGDLTSEDISCNFQSKYHIISRSFITPHMRKQKRMGIMGGDAFQSQSCDPLTEQLRKLVSLEGDDSDRDRPQPPQLHQDAKYPQSHPQATSVSPVVPRDVDDSPPPLTRRLSSRSQSRVRHINNRARERQQEALKPRAGVVINSTASIGGVVLRNKPASQNPPANRHSTGSYIAGYFGQLEDRGLPEGACTSLLYGNGDQYGDRYYTDDSLQTPNNSASEPEVYFLLRL